MPSVMQRLGTPNSRHNVDIKYRAQLENVDPTLSKYNTAVHRKTVEQIYAEKLQPAFDAFNARQKRKDRRLDVKWGATTALDYQRALDKAARESKNSIDQKGRPPIREIVWQIGNPEQGYGSRSQTRESRENIKQMLLECQTKAEKRFPQFAWGDQDFHADEVSQDADEQEHGSLHLHSAFVPLCFKNKQGPAVQVAFERCLKEMGFATFQDFKHELDSLMEEVLKEHGLERTVMDNHREHQSSKEFHRQQKIIKQTQELEAKAAAAEKVADEADREAEAAKLGATEAQNRKDELLAEIEKLEKKKSDAEGDAAEARERMQAESEAAAEAARKAEQAAAGGFGGTKATGGEPGAAKRGRTPNRRREG